MRHNGIHVVRIFQLCARGLGLEIGMRFFAIVLAVTSLFTSFAISQTSSGTLRGRVTDPSGAVVPQAKVTATGADGKSAEVLSNQQGVFQFKALAPGSYTVTATAKGFAVDTEAEVKVAAGQTQELDIALQIAVEEQHVEVQEESPTVGVS